MNTENIQELIQTRKLKVVVDYFGSKYKGIVCEIEDNKDGTYTLKSVDPRMDKQL